MPELPEVETTVRGIAPWLEHQTIMDVVVRCPKLRWPIPSNLNEQLVNQTVESVYRRGKYIIIQTQNGALIIHLGMSGRLCFLSKKVAPQKHDHVDFIIGDSVLRYTDPRRFGAVLWTKASPLEHPLLKSLGPEPLFETFNVSYLLRKIQKRHVPIKPFIMDNKIVVGVGNIYATEALFLARINPQRQAMSLTFAEAHELVQSIKQVLTHAIATGGSTLKDFFNSDGKPGYFTQHLNVYGRKNQTCFVCQAPLQICILGQRSTVFCKQCQK